MNHRELGDPPIGMRFSILHRLFKRAMDERLRDFDLTGVQLGVLAALDGLERSGDEEATQRDLENFSRVTHPTMTDILKRLEKKELISCRPRQSDRRYKCICLTDKARRLLEEISQVDKSVLRQICHGLSEEQVAQFIRITDVMLRNAMENNEKGSEGCVDKDACGECTGV